ncbi:MAG: peptide-methionine (S)-S-oxide reductase MsrA [Pseudomonadota bacterium]
MDAIQKTLIGSVMFVMLLIGVVLVFGRAHAAPNDTSSALNKHPLTTQVATFAGGCFWCMEKPFDVLDGVLSTTSGYMGGSSKDATYKKVSQGGTDHVEVIQVKYDPRVVSYATLLTVFWRNIDPKNSRGQFCDVGSQYRSAVFAHGTEQARQANASRARVESQLGRISTQVESAATFYPAEAYHQDYYLKNPLRYRYYRSRCGRDQRLKALWGDAPSKK